MATNFVQLGKILSTANATGSTILAGLPILAGNMWRIAINDIAHLASGPAFAEGVFTLPATSADAWADGALLYWDPATSKLTNVAGALKVIGHAVDLKAALTLTAKVKLAAF
jgi:predicted RecA/RadA family phage recombinase